MSIKDIAQRIGEIAKEFSFTQELLADIAKEGLLHCLALGFERLALLAFKRIEPLDTTTIRADICISTFIQTIQIEKGHPSRIQQSRTCLKILSSAMVANDLFTCFFVFH